MVSVLPKEGFITAKELASFLGISEPSVKAYVKRTNLHFVVIGKKWLIDLSQFGARSPTQPRSHTETRESGAEMGRGGARPPAQPRSSTETPGSGTGESGLKKLKKKVEEMAQAPPASP